MIAPKILKAAMLLAIALLPQGNLLATRTWTGLGADNSLSNPTNWSNNTSPQEGEDIIFPDHVAGYEAPLTYNAPFNSMMNLNFGNVTFTATNTTYNMQKTATVPIFLKGVANPGNGTTAANQIFTCRGANSVTLQHGASTNSSTVGSVTYNVSSTQGALTFLGDSPYKGGIGGAVVVTGGGVVSSSSGYTIELGSLSASGGALLFQDGNTLRVGKDNTSTTISVPICLNPGTSCALDKVGTGTLTLVGNQNFTGPTTVNGGTLALQNSAIKVSSDIFVAPGHQLQLNATDNSYTYANKLSGGGNVEITAPANSSVIFTGPNTFHGTTTLNPNATLTLVNEAIKAPTNITIGSNAQLILKSDTASQNYPGAINGNTSGVLNKTGNNQAILSGTSTFAGATEVKAGTLTLQNNAIQIPSNITLERDNTCVLELNSTNGGSYTYGNAISDSNTGKTLGTVTKSGPGRATLAGKNTYQGNTSITEGTLAIKNIAIPNSTNYVLKAGSNASLEFNTTQEGPYTYANVISDSGTGTLGTVIKSGTQELILSGNNTYKGNTSITGGKLTLKNEAITTTTNYILAKGANASLEFNATNNESYTYGNTISDSGTVVKSGSNQLTLTGKNTYQGTTLVTGGKLTVVDQAQEAPTAYDLSAGTTLEFKGATTGSYTQTQAIGGQGALLKSGAQHLILAGANSYKGPTTNQDGGKLTLKDAATQVPSNISSSKGTVLEFNVHSDDRTYANTLSGGEIQKTGPGKMSFTGHSNVHTLNINAGELNLKDGASVATTNGPVVVKSGARISGTGALTGGGLTINSGGFIKPGNSSGTFTTAGPFVQNGTYEIQIDGPTNANVSLINITSGTTTLNNSKIALVGLSNYNVKQPYKILTTSGNALTDTFNGGVDAAALSTILHANLTYDDHSVYMTLQRKFTTPGLTPNQKSVATQIDSLTNTSEFLESYFEKLTFSSQSDINKALDQMGGEQHTSSVLMAQNLNHQFIRRLYDPLRLLVVTQPDLNACKPCKSAPDACDPCKSFFDGWTFWSEAGGGGTRLKSNGNAHGLNSTEFEVTVGAQTMLDDNLTVGIAGSYAHNHIGYTIGGAENINSGFGGLYALYRPECYYILADIAFGYNKGNLSRPIQVGDTDFAEAHSKPQVTDFSFYAEFGVDFCFWDFGVQPYAAIEVDTIWRKQVIENNAFDLNLTVNKLTKTFTSGSLGVHMTQALCGYTFGLDLAWVYRFTSYESNITSIFEAPGSTPFVIDGVPVDKNSMEGTLFLSKEICDGWNIYGELTGQVWSRFVSYDALIGVQASW